MQKIDPKLEQNQLQTISEISNIKSLSAYFKRLSYPISTETIKFHLESVDSDLVNKLEEIETLLSKFSNESIINVPILDEINLEGIDRNLLSSEYHDYLRNDINLFTVHQQMSERSQVKVLKDWVNTMILGYVQAIPTNNLARVSHSLLLIGYTMITISHQIKK